MSEPFTPYRNRSGPVIVEIPKLLDRQPPIAPEAEAAVLGSMLIDPACIADVMSVIREAAAFYTEANQAIYQGLLTLGDKHGQADVMLLAQALNDAGKLDGVGGPDYLMQLANAVPTSANAVYYAQIVAEKHRLRRLITAAGEILHEVYERAQATGEDAKLLIDKAEQRIFEIAQQEQVSEAEELGKLVMQEWTRIQEAEGRGLASGIKTGFDQLDEMLGGLQPGEMIILAARPSMGKTAIAMNIAELAALGTNIPYSITPQQGRQRNAVGFFSLEMSKASVCQRLMSAWARISSQDIRSGHLRRADYQTLLDAAKDLAEAPIFIDDTPGLSITALRARARRMVANHKVKLIVVDYMQLLTAPAQAKESRQVEVSAISRGVKALARELNVPIIALSQLNRGAENREGNRPRMSDLRESGSLEQDADVVLLLHREEYYHKGEPAWDPNSPEFDELNREKINLAEIIVAKQRNGPTGAVKLTFVPGETRFKNRSDGDAFAGVASGGGGGGGGARGPVFTPEVDEVGSSGYHGTGGGGFSGTVRSAGPIESHRDGGGPDRGDAAADEPPEEAPF
ncbi:MAG: replicative DNA helicase [Phycisphaerales bacterium]|nr:replicative DNA helicase [Phycisphaerales bacterium]